MVQENTTFLLQQLFNNETIYKIDYIEKPELEANKLVNEDSKEVVVSNDSQGLPDKTQLPKEEDKIVTPQKEFKPCIVIVNTFSEVEKDLLTKILMAVNLTINEVTILELNEAKLLDFKWLLNNEPIKYLITFGIDLPTIGLKIPLELYVAKQIKGIHFLMSDSLGAIQNDNNKKRLIWNALKQIFAI